MKIRIEVLNQVELDTFVETLKYRYKVLNVSKMYQNRNNNYNRVYIELEEKVNVK